MWRMGAGNVFRAREVKNSLYRVLLSLDVHSSERYLTTAFGRGTPCCAGQLKGAIRCSIPHDERSLSPNTVGARMAAEEEGGRGYLLPGQLFIPMPKVEH